MENENGVVLDTGMDANFKHQHQNNGHCEMRNGMYEGEHGTHGIATRTDFESSDGSMSQLWGKATQPLFTYSTTPSEKNDWMHLLVAFEMDDVPWRRRRCTSHTALQGKEEGTHVHDNECNQGDVGRAEDVHDCLQCTPWKVHGN